MMKLNDILSFVEQERQHKIILPKQEQILRCLEYFEPWKTKVIVVSQDPYPNKQDACGLAFSVEHSKYPPSLRNIFKELKNDLGIDLPITGNLEPWAKQGVLLLNSILTLEEGKSLSHSHIGWQEYTTQLIQTVLDYKQPVVILAWGKYAQDKIMHLNTHSKCIILKGSHPSPLARPNKGFFGGCYFSKTNHWLRMHKVEPINWTL